MSMRGTRIRFNFRRSIYKDNGHRWLIEGGVLNWSYKKTLKLCHSTVGAAIVNTSITIIFGFSILIFSNFIPTIYFGIFTGIAMLLAMLLVLTLLPCLIILIKPFGIRTNV